MATARTIITAALQKLGLIGSGEAVEAVDAATCLEALNRIVDSWAVTSLYSYTTTETVFTLGAGVSARTIGAGQQINVTRPVRIEPSFSRISGVDKPLEPVGESEFNEIQLKTINGSWPAYCHYDGGAPVGNVYFWPVPSESVEVHLVTTSPLAAFGGLDATYTFTPGYERALVFSLAEEVAPFFGTQPTPFVVSQAAAARRAIRRANFQVPRLRVEDRQMSPLERLYSGL